MIIGVSGKSCTGKNIIGSILENQGALHLDLDQINKGLLEREIKGLTAIFGEQILNTTGGLNKSALANIVFSDKKKLTLLEEYIHPIIDEEVKKIIYNEDPNRIIVINGAVLHKSTLVSDIDKLLFIQSHLFLRFFRALKRDGFHTCGIFKRFWNQRDIVPQLFPSNVDIYKVNNNRTRRYLEKILSGLLQEWSK